MKSEQRKALLNVSCCPPNCVSQLLHITSFRLHSHDPTSRWAISSIAHLSYTNYFVTVLCSRVTWVCANS